MAITEQDRACFVEGVARLSLSYLSSQNPTADRWYTLLTGQSPLYRLTEYWDGHTSLPVSSPEDSGPGTLDASAPADG